MGNLTVSIPSICTAEVKYVFHCLLREFLGLEYSVDTTSSLTEYVISYNNRSIIIENHFFLSDVVSEICCIESLPEICTKSNCHIGDEDYPFVTMFGSDEIEILEHIRIKSDIIAATYFMLSRWEEGVVKIRDEHDRFPGQSSVAHRNDFLDRPVVNEYVELLWQWLIYIGYDKTRKERKYRIVPTHDLDDPLMWMTNQDTVRSIMYSTLKSPSISQISKKIKGMIAKKDPYDSYEILMNKAESVDATATFYFLTGGETRYDRKYRLTDDKIKNIVTQILDRNHIIGLHPSYGTYKDVDLLQKEKSNFTTIDIHHSRQHYLRLSVPTSFENWDRVGLIYDSTLGYADASGFRCGMCYEFPLFDYRNRKQLHIIEQPLIVMDVTLKQYELLTPDKAINRVERLQSEVKKYNGDFVFLWHNSSFFTKFWHSYEGVFQSMYN